MDPFFAVAIIMVIVVLVGIRDLVGEKKRKVAWQDIAERQRLQFTNDRIHGEIRDVVVRVFIEIQGTGKNQTTWTIVTASVDGEVPLGLKLSPEKFFAKMLKFSKTTDDIQLDLPGIDEKLLVNGADPDEVRRWAQRADVSRALVDLTEINEHFEVAPHRIRVVLSGGVHDRERLERLLDKLVDIARALSGKGYGALIDDGSW